MLALAIGLTTGAAWADPVPVQLEGSIAGMETTLPTEAGYHISVCQLHAESLACLERAALDADQGSLINPTEWSTVLGGTIGTELVVATDPQPAQDLRIAWGDQELTACLPDTQHTSHGASFAISDDGSSWWLDEGHDGSMVGDRVSVSEALQDRHLARSCDEGPGTWQAVDGAAERVDISVTAESERAFQLALQLGEGQVLAWPDGTPLLAEELGAALGEAFGIEDEGVPVSSTHWAGTTGRAEPLRAVTAALDEASGWPEPTVQPGILAVDLELGRVAFSGGNTSNDIQLLGHYHTHWGGGHFGARWGDLYAMVLGESDASFILVDISDPSAPNLASVTDCGWAYGAVRYEGYAYVYARDGLHVVDIADPAAPEHRDTIAFDLGGYAVSAQLQDDRLVVSTKTAWAVLDLSTPASPTVLFEGELDLDLGEGDQLWFPGDGWGYVWSSLTETLEALDFEDPYDPQRILSLVPTEEPVPIGGVLHDGDLLFTALWGDGVAVFDISEPDRPTEVFHYETYPFPPMYDEEAKDTALCLTLNEDRLYVAGQYGFGEDLDPQQGIVQSYLQVFDVSDPDAIHLEREHVEAGVYVRPVRLDVEGDRLWLFDGSHGLRIADLSTHGSFGWEGSYTAVGMGVDVVVHQERAWMSQYLGGGVHVIDVSDPSAPASAGYVHDGRDAYGLAVTDGRWLHWGGKLTRPWYDQDEWFYVDLNTWDLVDEQSPVFSAVSDGYPHMGLDHHGDFLSAGAQLWDLEDPGAPVLVYESETMGGQHAARHGDYLVYGTGRSDLSWPPESTGEDAPMVAAVWDVANLAAPTLVALVTVPDASTPFITNTVVRSGVAYFSDGVQVNALDLADPRTPTLASRLTLQSSSPGGLDVLEDYLFLQDEYGPLQVYDLSLGLESASLLGEVLTTYTRKTVVEGEVAYTPAANGLYMIRVPRSTQAPAGSVTAWFHVAELDVEDTGLEDTGDGLPVDSEPEGVDTGDSGEEPVVVDNDRPSTCGCAVGSVARGPFWLALVCVTALAWRRRDGGSNDGKAGAARGRETPHGRMESLTNSRPGP